MKLKGMRQHMRQEGGKYVAKKAFPTKDKAIKMLVATDTHSSMCAYECEICGSWHVGRMGE